MNLFRIERLPRLGGLAVAAGLVLGGCESSPGSSPPPVERPFSEVFTLQSRVRLQSSPDDPIADPTAILRWGNRVVVVDEMQSNLKLFDPSGALVGVIGRAGDGPGEFRRPFSVAALPDGSLAVLDRTGLSVSRFSAAGEYLSRWRFQGISPTGVSSLPDGRLLLGVRSPDLPQSEAAHLRIYSADGELQQRFTQVIADNEVEAKIQRFLPAVVGHTVLAATTSRQFIRFRDLRSGRDWTAEFGERLIPPPDWTHYEPGSPPSDLLEWVNAQHWTNNVVPLDSTRFLMVIRGPMKEGKPRVRYVVGDVGGRTLAVTSPSQTALLHASDGAIYGIEMTEEGEMDLLTFRLRLEGGHRERQASR